MKKSIPLFSYGAIIIIAGLFLILSTDSSLTILRFTLGVTLSVASILAFITSLSHPKRLVWFAYHEIHALAMLAYGLTIMVFGNSFDSLLSFTAILFMFYAFSEIIFCSRLFNLEQHVHLKIVLVRLVLGLLVAIGSVALIYYREDTAVILTGYGVVFMVIGINVLLYAPITKKDKTEKHVHKDLVEL
jgi:uncharacterized membrane protein HdeD (DUF308 family)